jgi:aspartate carbamoyltransferase regulatory subunit
MTDLQKKVTHHTSSLGEASCKTPKVENKEEPVPPHSDLKSPQNRKYRCEICGKICERFILFDTFLKRRLAKRRRLYI